MADETTNDGNERRMMSTKTAMADISDVNFDVPVTVQLGPRGGVVEVRSRVNVTFGDMRRDIPEGGIVHPSRWTSLQYDEIDNP